MDQIKVINRVDQLCCRLDLDIHDLERYLNHKCQALVIFSAGGKYKELLDCDWGNL